MKSIVHPSLNLKQEWIDLIRSRSAESENMRELHPEILDLIYSQQWFNLFVPLEYGGLNKTLPQAVRLEEALAWADGSLGWTLTLCAGANWFAGFLDSALAEKIFADKKACLAGSGAPTGTAVILPDGYLLDGKWKYATGAPHATMITANCVITENGKPLLNADGSPVIKAFVVDASAVKIIPNWNTIGLKATASHDFEIDNLKVSKANGFEIDPKKPHIDQPVFRYPFLQFAEVTLAANSSGMAVHFIDLAQEIFLQRITGKNLKPAETAVLEQVLAGCKTKMIISRTDFYQALDRSWKVLADGGIPLQLLNEVSAVSRKLSHAARECVDLLYTFCGLIAADSSSEINRVWRDIHTASQHTLLTFSV